MYKSYSEPKDFRGGMLQISDTILGNAGWPTRMEEPMEPANAVECWIPFAPGGDATPE
jgi:hypothetical protein